MNDQYSFPRVPLDGDAPPPPRPPTPPPPEPVPVLYTASQAARIHHLAAGTLLTPQAVAYWLMDIAISVLDDGYAPSDALQQLAEFRAARAITSAPRTPSHRPE